MLNVYRVNPNYYYSVSCGKPATFVKRETPLYMFFNYKRLLIFTGFQKNQQSDGSVGQ